MKKIQLLQTFCVSQEILTPVSFSRTFALNTKKIIFRA